MLSRTWLFLVPIVLLSGCEISVNEPPLESPVNLPECVVGLQGAWRFDAAFDVRYDSQMFTCHIVNATIDVGQELLYVSGAWYNVSGTVKGAALCCSQDSVEKWKVPLEGLEVFIRRTKTVLRFSFFVRTPFGTFGLDGESEFKAVANQDTWGGQMGVDIYPYSLVGDGQGKWTLSRRR